MRGRLLLLAAFLLAGAWPAAASAQFYINLAVTQSGAGLCGSAGVNVPVVGFIAVNLPGGTDNLYVSRTVSGQGESVELSTIAGPFPQLSPGNGNLDVPTPAPTLQPYTLVVYQFPASQGAPVGVGTRTTAVCAADGTVSVTFERGLPAPPPPAVPTLSAPMLALLAALLALAAAATGVSAGRRR
jgi:hypothetical protein